MVLEQSEAILGRKGYIYAHLLDDKFMPVVKDKLVAKLTHTNPANGQPRTEEVVFHPIPGRPGEYRYLSAHDQDGRFDLKIPGSDFSFPYEVKKPPGHEREEAPLAEETLSQAAKITEEIGGRYYREEDLHRLATDIQEKKTPFTLHQEILLWNPLAFLIFLVLITAEWVLRKLANLS
jgi:hypothetical protein